MFRHQPLSSGNDTAPRRGAFMVLAFFALIGTIAFVAFSIDTGHIALNKTQMQNAVDAAALAAAMEITHAVENAPVGEEDPTAYAREQAKIVAADTAQANGVYVDPTQDVIFGLRWFNPATEKFEVQWGVEPANAVKVKARRDNDDTSAPDGKLPMMFAGVLGDDSVTMGAEAIAYIESRDISVVLDFSGSMAYDSLFLSESVARFGTNAIRDNLRQMYWQLDTNPGQLGRLDRSDPDNGSSTLTPEVRYLTVHGQPQLSTDPKIDVTFKYKSGYVSSDLVFKKVKLLYDDGDEDEDTWNSQSFSGLSTKTGTYTGTGSNSSKNLDGVEVTVDVPGTGPVAQTGTLSGGDRPQATIVLNSTSSAATVNLNGDSLKKIQVWYTDGSNDSFSGLSGRSKTVQGDAGKTIKDVKVTTQSGASKKFLAFEVDSGYEYTEVFVDDNDAVKQYFHLAGVNYPYPSGSWDEYINYVRNDAEINRGTHREMYGGVTFVHYLLETRPSHNQTPALAKTSHYPYHAVRAGNELFVDFLDTLGFGDHVGLVSYDQYKRQELVLDEDGDTVDISADPIDDHYEAIKTIMRHKQANHYYARTNIGGGIREARTQIADHGRAGARPTILLMTDGNANVYERADGKNSQQGGFSNDDFYKMPAGFSWGVFGKLDTTDVQPFYINDDGSENTRARIFALSQAWQAAQEGTTVHTMTVGAGADTDLMKAIAFLGGGEYIEVNGALTVEGLLEQCQAGFYRIAALVPPARIADPDETTP